MRVYTCVAVSFVENPTYYHMLQSLLLCLLHHVVLCCFRCVLHASTRCSVVQCGTALYSVLQCVAVCCGVVQCAYLQYVAGAHTEESRKERE